MVISLSPSNLALVLNRFVNFLRQNCAYRADTVTQGLAKGTDIPEVGAVQITWYTGQLANSTSKKSTTSFVNTESKDFIADRAPSPAPDVSHMHEEEIISGWGGDDDNDFGMM